MSQQKRRDKVVHALTVCRCVQTDGRVSSGSFSVAAAKEAGHKQKRTADFWIASRVGDEDIPKLGDAGTVAGEKDVGREGAVTYASLDLVVNVH